jgi:PIN domain nuclease of toxin-antitoxin system
MNRLLLDTQVWLWMNASPSRLSSSAMQHIEDAETELLFSAVCSWEIAIKYALGKLPLPDAPDVYVPRRIADTNVTPISIEHTHALRVADLPPVHQDPFDRLLVVQSIELRAPILSADPVFREYEVDVVSA